MGDGGDALREVRAARCGSVRDLFQILNSKFNLKHSEQAYRLVTKEHTRLSVPLPDEIAKGYQRLEMFSKEIVVEGTIMEIAMKLEGDTALEEGEELNAEIAQEEINIQFQTMSSAKLLPTSLLPVIWQRALEISRGN